MAVTVHLPKIGMTMEEGILASWLAPDGSPVVSGQPIFELETEKVTQDVEAGAAGTLKHLVAAGWTVAPGAVVGCLLDDGESAVPQELLDRVAEQTMRPPEGGSGGAGGGTDAASVAPPPQQPLVAAPTPAAARSPGARAVASPAARKLATQHGLDLDAIEASGPGGRIQERDVLAAIEAGAPAAVAPPVANASDADAAASVVHAPIPYRGRRRTIGQRMHESMHSMAQLTLSGEVDVEAAVQQLHGLNREWRSERVVVTFTMLVVKAAALALRDHPRLNARLDGDQIVVESAVNVGLAVDHEDGLMVPVLRDADHMPLQDLARRVAILTDLVKDNSLGVDDVSGGTFTVTSLEGFNVDTFTPVINPPQAAILGVGRVRDVARFDGSSARRGQASTLSLAFDHRLMDGAPAARFLDRVMELLNRPYVLM